MQSRIPKLVVLAKGRPREIEMGQELTIGRGYSNLLRLDGEEISRVHAIIYRRNQNFILRDLDSKNGVFVNGSRIAMTELGPGDKVQVGKYKMVFDPPAGFDINILSDSESCSNGSTGNRSAPLDDVHASDDDFEKSYIFSGSSSSQQSVTEDPTQPEILREEVLIMTRGELYGRLLEKDTITDKAVDYQDILFRELTHPSEGPVAEGGDHLLTALLHALVKAIDADRGAIVLRDPQSGQLTPGAIVPVNSDVSLNRIVLRMGFTEGKAVLCPITRECGLFRDSKTVARERINSLISIPLTDHANGLLYLDRQGESEPFNPAHLLVVARAARIAELHLSGRKTVHREPEV